MNIDVVELLEKNSDFGSVIMEKLNEILKEYPDKTDTYVFALEVIKEVIENEQNLDPVDAKTVEDYLNR